MDDGAACEVVCGGADRLRDRAIRREDAAVPHHVGHGSIIEGDPQRHEDHPRAVLDAFGDRAADEGDGDHGERGLERHVHACRVVVAVQTDRCEHAVLRHHRVAQQESCGRITEHTTDRIAGVCDRPSPQAPDEHRDGQRGGLHHQHVEHGLRTDHAAVEKRHTWRHQEHKTRRGQNPRGIAGIKLSHTATSLLCSLSFISPLRATLQ